MQFPADLSNGALNASTSATPNSGTSTLVIAAPGAGHRLRIWAWSAGLAQNMTGVVRGQWRRDVGGSTVGVIAVSPQTPGMHSIIPGGLPLNENEGLGIIYASNVATQSVQFRAYYTTEEV